MQPDLDKVSSEVKKEENDCNLNGSDSSGRFDRTSQEPIDVSSEDEDHSLVEDDQSKQLVLYDPGANNAGEIVPAPEPLNCAPLPRRRAFQPSGALPAVGAFTVQCANCFQWRLIPTKEKYEEIREHILETPFYCETARQWRPDVSCDDPGDIQQDNSRLWAIDKPNIAQPPPGWQRLLRIRGEGSTKFADVYYVAPSGKRLRSMVEIQKYLSDHPEYMSEGITLSQFTFQTPRPLQENYVRKRVAPPRLTAPHDDGMSRPLEPDEVNPLSWRGPADSDLQLGRQGVSDPYFEAPVPDPVERPVKKRIKITSSRQLFNQ